MSENGLLIYDKAARVGQVKKVSEDTVSKSLKATQFQSNASIGEGELGLATDF